MASVSRRSHLQVDPNLGLSDSGRELFEACRNGDLNKVKKLVSTHNVNAKDTAGRKSSPLHFAAGESSDLDFHDKKCKQKLLVFDTSSAGARFDVSGESRFIDDIQPVHQLINSVDAFQHSSQSAVPRFCSYINFYRFDKGNLVARPKAVVVGGGGWVGI